MLGEHICIENIPIFVVELVVWGEYNVYLNNLYIYEIIQQKVNSRLFESIIYRGGLTRGAKTKFPSESLAVFRF